MKSCVAVGLLALTAPSLAAAGPRPEAARDFGAAVSAYRAAVRTGAVRARCAAIAAGFARVYERHRLPQAGFNEGAVWQACGRPQRAARAYLALLRSHPDYGPALNNLGQLDLASGRLELALSRFRQAARRNSSAGYTNLAVLDRRRAQRTEEEGRAEAIRRAVNNVHRALAVDSSNMKAYNNLALVLYEHATTCAQLETARLVCVQALRLDPRYAPLHNTLGLILLRQQNVTGALARFRRAAALDGGLVAARMNIGAITLSVRDYRAAERAFRRVLGLRPGRKLQLEATVGLGVALRGLRRYGEAMQRYRQARALDPANVEVAYNMGILLQDYLFDGSDRARAVRELRRAAGLLRRYLAAGSRADKKRDCQRRLKNIEELLAMLR